MAVLVKRDSVKGWRVVCDLHGELACYASYWRAVADALQHRENCEAVSDAETK